MPFSPHWRRDVTIPHRLGTIKLQAEWHHKEATNCWSELEKLKRQSAAGAATPVGSLDRLEDRFHRHTSVSRALEWAFEELDEKYRSHQHNHDESGTDNNSSTGDSSQNQQHSYSDRPLPPEAPESKRIRDYIVRYLWDGIARNPKWLKDIILLRTSEDIPQDKIARSLNHMHKRLLILDKVESEGSGYYKIRDDYKSSNQKP